MHEAPPLGSNQSIRIATAGWTIPRAVSEQFPTEGSGLERYAAKFDAAEINTTFYRNHRPTTYVRWYAATPSDFRFAVKLPQAITHRARLLDVTPLLRTFRDEVAELRDKLGPLLVQLPPSLAYAAPLAERFFADLCDLWGGPIACEPRHESWFGPSCDALLREHRVARVAADPAPHPSASLPGGWGGLAYWRLHGSPRMYYSRYEDARLRTLAKKLRSAEAAETWCVFDNTASGSAAADALRLQAIR